MISIIFILTVIFVLLRKDNIRLYRAINEIGKDLREAKDILEELQKIVDANEKLIKELKDGE